ncbi:DUF4388 domain-containing protein [Ktedonospora formicarum]|uniref:PatA-like N-terminal domain-containing protein n=1 Tax=Ktedonospora formicarum TaxID=2778364 RepID=A0A8J3HXV9_9CHLR|nr:DUF4388 domain-containing protein [Ktedonospora formicarum]GHO42968.1 hypothetical protein KSX_11310 [Ktedonospora formicarum]
MEQQDRIMDGDLQTLGLQSILKMLALSEKTGKLFVSSGPDTLSISLRKGKIVGLHEEGVPQPDLLSMLCLINRLDPPRVQQIQEMARGNMQIALQLLVERGWMPASEMQRRLEFAVTQSISHAMRWVNGRFSFHRQLLPMDTAMQPLDVDSVLLEALRQADEWEEIVAEGITQLTRSVMARWSPDVKRDLRSLGLNQDTIEVLCLCNGELPLQAIALVQMTPEARVARVMMQLLNLHLIEVVDTALENNLQLDLSNIIIRCQTTLQHYREVTNVEQLLLGLIKALCDCVNELFVHHGSFARSLRGRGQLTQSEIMRFIERRFVPPLQELARHQYPILETATFIQGQLDCSDILTLNKVVKGEQLEEFYGEAVLGLSAYLRMVFDALAKDEVGNSHMGRQIAMAWRVLLSEIDGEIQKYQFYRAQKNVQQARGQRVQQMQQGSPFGIVQNTRGAVQNEGEFWSPETQRRTI